MILTEEKMIIQTGDQVDCHRDIKEVHADPRDPKHNPYYRQFEPDSLIETKVNGRLFRFFNETEKPNGAIPVYVENCDEVFGYVLP